MTLTNIGWVPFTDLIEKVRVPLIGIAEYHLKLFAPSQSELTACAFRLVDEGFKVMFCSRENFIASRGNNHCEMIECIVTKKESE